MWLGKRGKSWVLFLCEMAVSVDAFAQQPKEIRITANEFSYKPAKIQAAKGEVKITVTNRGKFRRGFAIMDREEKIDTIESGQTKSMVVKLDKEGEIIFYCPQPGHRGRGMEGTLSVGTK